MTTLRQLTAFAPVVTAYGVTVIPSEAVLAE
jgi:hypothetical protein